MQIMAADMFLKNYEESDSARGQDVSPELKKP
jgi:hypothetical protein